MCGFQGGRPELCYKITFSKNRGWRKNWSVSDPTDPTGSAGPVYNIIYIPTPYRRNNTHTTMVYQLIRRNGPNQFGSGTNVMLTIRPNNPPAFGTGRR